MAGFRPASSRSTRLLIRHAPARLGMRLTPARTSGRCQAGVDLVTVVLRRLAFACGAEAHARLPCVRSRRSREQRSLTIGWIRVNARKLGKVLLERGSRHGDAASHVGALPGTRASAEGTG